MYFYSCLMNSQGQAALFFKDQAGDMDAYSYTSSNVGFIERTIPTKDGGTASIEGCLYLDLGLEQKRAILNAVNLIIAINLKLFQATDEFRLMRSGSENYKLKIKSAILKVCHVSLHPSMIVAHNEALELSPAVYPFWRSDIKSFTIAAGSHTFMRDNIFHGEVPSKIIIGLVSNAAYSDYTKNPSDFQIMDLNYFEINVDGQPNRPFRPTFAENVYVASYLSLLDNEFALKNGIIIKASDFPQGYALYLFDVQSFISGGVMTKSAKGHVRLSMRFATAIKETIIP